MMKKMKSPNSRKWRSLLLLPIVIILSLAFTNPISRGSNFEDQKGSTESHLVKGKVTAEDTNKPLPGASVIIKGINTGTVSDENGEFALEVEEENIMLSVSFIGYETFVVQAKKGDFLNIVLKPKIDKEELRDSEKKPVIQLGSIDSAIYKATLYIIDGKEIIKEEVDKYFRDPDIIHSISILKGETAVEKYGEKGKNGVIIITTKDYISNNSNIKYKVSGNVLNAETDKPMAGVSIVIVNTTIGTITDLNGEFLLQIDKKPIQLAFFFGGFETQIVDVKDGEKLEIRLKKQ